MSIIVTGEDEKNVPQDEQVGVEEEIKYEATEDDEEGFFLIYHMNMAPSEVDKLTKEYRRWLIARCIHQKKMEQAMFQEAKIRQQLASGLQPNPANFNLVK